MTDETQAHPSRKPAAANIIEVAVGVVAACLVASIVFGVAHMAPVIDHHGMKSVNLTSFVVLFAFLVSFLPTLVVMTVLVVSNARAWWLYLAAGVGTAMLTLALFVWGFTDVRLAGITALSGAAGGLAAWLALRSVRNKYGWT